MSDCCRNLSSPTHRAARLATSRLMPEKGDVVAGAVGSTALANLARASPNVVLCRAGPQTARRAGSLWGHGPSRQSRLQPKAAPPTSAVQSALPILHDGIKKDIAPRSCPLLQIHYVARGRGRMRIFQPYTRRHNGRVTDEQRFA